jgi:hypothetical protein
MASLFFLLLFALYIFSSMLYSFSLHSPTWAFHLLLYILFPLAILSALIFSHIYIFFVSDRLYRVIDLQILVSATSLLSFVSVVTGPFPNAVFYHRFRNILCNFQYILVDKHLSEVSVNYPTFTSKYLCLMFQIIRHLSW